MAGETDLALMLRTLTVTRRPGRYVFVTVDEERAAGLRGKAAASVVEDEGATLVLPAEAADAEGLPYDFVAAWLTLDVRSALEAVGLTAAFSAALAGAGISCNVLAGFHHDHLLVPEDRAEDALAALAGLRKPPPP
ncbi:ACT domain-containing protein [Actinorugispora endophytica]|uniref:Uncharacterized protein n=1 Tax=Actinorugispora endophytica TaxID=1605990 RepID=A0A4R6V975_9ACTN|nr:ACT domain-containing protein [Actinorugispora endophytica]TDQ52988.1 hypothetical protein EV190_105105 [Actinorugispora endophytica]